MFCTRAYTCALCSSIYAAGYNTSIIQKSFLWVMFCNVNEATCLRYIHVNIVLRWTLECFTYGTVTSGHGGKKTAIEPGQYTRPSAGSRKPFHERPSRTQPRGNGILSSLFYRPNYTLYGYDVYDNDTVLTHMCHYEDACNVSYAPRST